MGYIKNNVPEDSSSESSTPGDISSEKLKNNSLTLKKTSHTDGAGEDNNLTDLFPGKSSHPRHDQHFDITEDILLQVDSKIPQAIDLGEKVKDNLAKRVSTHYKQKNRKTENQPSEKRFQIDINCQLTVSIYLFRN